MIALTLLGESPYGKQKLSKMCFFLVMRHDERVLEQNLLNETKKLRLEKNGAGTDEISTGLEERR